MYIFMLTCYLLMFFNIINLTLTGISGVFDITIMGASHIRFALFSILVFTITETIVMYFFITTGKAIKNAIELGEGDQVLWDKERKLKMKLFPQLMLSITLIGGWFIHIGAVENNISPLWLHNIIFFIAYIHHLWSLGIKNNAFKEQLLIIDQLSPKSEIE